MYLCYTNSIVLYRYLLDVALLYTKVISTLHYTSIVLKLILILMLMPALILLPIPIPILYYDMLCYDVLYNAIQHYTTLHYTTLD